MAMSFKKNPTAQIINTKCQLNEKSNIYFVTNKTESILKTMFKF